MSENVVPLRPDIALPRMREVERLRFFPSDELNERISALCIPPEEQLGRTAIFLYSIGYEDVMRRRGTLSLEDTESEQPRYNHGLHQIIAAHKNRKWPMKLRKKVGFKRIPQNKDLYIGLFVDPHPLLTSHIRESHFIDKASGTIPVFAHILGEELTKEKALKASMVELRRFVIGSLALRGPSSPNIAALSPNPSARVDAADLAVRREYL